MKLLLARPGIGWARLALYGAEEALVITVCRYIGVTKLSVICWCIRFIYDIDVQGFFLSAAACWPSAFIEVVATNGKCRARAVCEEVLNFRARRRRTAAGFAGLARVARQSGQWPEAEHSPTGNTQRIRRIAMPSRYIVPLILSSLAAAPAADAATLVVSNTQDL